MKANYQHVVPCSCATQGIQLQGTAKDTNNPTQVVTHRLDTAHRHQDTGRPHRQATRRATLVLLQVRAAYGHVWA